MHRPGGRCTAKMNMSHPLLPGTIQQLYEGKGPKDCWVQVIHLKLFDKEQAPVKRYK